MKGSVRILHVDDDSSFTTLTRQFLTRQNDQFEVTTETSSRAGLRRLETESIDCIVSDYEMPEMDGLAFLEAVRQEGYEIPFILFTGSGSEQIASQAISTGVTDYITRDHGTDQYVLLANRIETAVTRYRSQCELESTRRRLSLFVDQSPFGVIEWSNEAEIQRVNETAETVLGYEEPELRGRSWESLFPERHREEVGDVVDSLLAGTEIDPHIAETLTKDGETILCNWHNHLVKDGEEILAAYSQFEDITERIETRRQFETMIDNLPGIIYRHRFGVDQTFESLRGSCEELTGYSQTELQEDVSIDEELIYPEDREHVQTEMLGEQPDDSYELTYRIRRKDGEIRRIWERGQQYRSTRKQAHFREGLLIDITEIPEHSVETA